MANTAFDGKPYAGNPHVRIDEGDGASAKPRRASLLYMRTIKRVAALAVMVAVTLCTGNLFGWNAKRTLSNLKTFSTPAERGTYLVQSINGAANNDWLEIPDGVEYMTFPSCVTISKNLKLTFAGTSSQADLYGNKACRHFEVTSGTLELEGLWFNDGKDTSGYAGSIFITGGAVKATRCTFSGNQSVSGAGSWGGAVSVYPSGSFEAVGCAFSGNVSQSTGNNAYGGALFASGNGRLTLTRCSLVRNKATPAAGNKSYGGALYSCASHSSTAPGVICVNCTFDNNENAIFLRESAKAVLAYCTVANNVNNYIDKGYPLTLEGSAKAYVLGSVFFGNQDSTGVITSYQGIVKDTATLYAGFTISNFASSGSGQAVWTAKMGPIPDVRSKAPGKFFYTWSGSLPTVETCDYGGMTYRFCTVKPSDGSSNFYSDKFIWHNSDWSTIGMGTASAASEVLWGSGTTSALTVVEKYDIVQNLRPYATHNIPGSYCQMKCNITVNGNGGRLNNSAKSTSETVTAPYSPNGPISVSAPSAWMNVCYHCVGFTNAYLSGVANNNISCKSIGSTYAYPASAKTLYCKWERNTYNVKFNANGGTGTMSDQVMTNGITGKLRSNVFTRSGHVFLGWAKSSASAVTDFSNAQGVADLVKSTSNNQTINLYAVWMSTSAPVVADDSQLRPAIENAVNGVTITVKPDISVGISSPYVINKSLKIKSEDPTRPLNINANNKCRAFEIASSKEVWLEGIEIYNGGKDSVYANNRGGAILNRGILHVDKCYFHNNIVRNGNDTDNSTYGGAIYNDTGATLYVNLSTFKGNGCYSSSGNAHGGAIYNNGGKVTFNQCSFYQNWVDGVEEYGGSVHGGAICSVGTNSYVVIANTTVAANTNALYFADGKAALVHATVVGNKYGNGNWGEAINARTMARFVVASSVVVGNQTTKGGPEVGTRNNIWATLASGGTAGAYFSMIGKCNNISFTQNYSNSFNDTYAPGDYFVANTWNTTTKLPDVKSRTLYGVPQYYYELKDGVTNGKYLGRTQWWGSFGYKVSGYGTVFPTHEFTTSAVSTLTNSSYMEVYDQLMRHHTTTASDAASRSWTAGATQNSVVTLRYNANGGTGTRADSYGYASPHGTFTPAANTFSKSGYTFQAWTNKFTTAELVPNTSYLYSKLFNVSTTDSSLYAGTHFLYAKWKPNTWYVKFDKNSTAATGTMANETMTYDTAKALTANAFTRTGYTFAGWAISATGSVLYGNQASVKNLTTASGGVYTLYAVWQENAPLPPPVPTTYTIHFVGGTGATGTAPADMTGLTASANVTLPGAGSLAKSGYAFKGWAKTSGATTAAFTAGQSVTKTTLGATLGATLTLYAVWGIPPVPPPGPTPEEISDPTNPIYDPTSPEFVPPELYQTKAKTAFAGNVQYAGWVRDANGALKGSLLVKAAKAKKDFTSKLSVTYTPFGGKKTTIKGLSPVNPQVGGKPTVTIPGVGAVTLGDESFASAGNLVQVGQDFTKSKNKAVKAAATARLAGKTGSYTFALGLSGKYAGFTVTVDKKGKGKLAGVLPDGTKVSVSSQGVLGDQALAIPFVYAKKGSFGLVFWVYDNGVLGVSDLTAFKNAAGQVQTLTWHGVSHTHELAAGVHLASCTVNGGTLQFFTFANNKWTFPKKDDNPHNWKMTYKAKDGSAKGQFTVLDSNGKKVKYTVNGAVVGHTFYGTAYNKKSGAFPVTAE